MGRTSDAVRQVVVGVGALVAVVGAFVGSGAAGGPSQPEIGDGALASDATLVAPGQPAFAIWSVIYTGLVALAVWQGLPARRADPRQRRVGWWVLVSMLLNAVWIAVVQAGWLGASVPVIAVLLGVLVLVVLRLGERPASGVLERVLVDGTLGLYLGWVSVATVANVAAVLADAGYTSLGLGATTWAVLVLAVAAAVGAALAVRTGGRLAIAAAMAWGLGWIALARATAQPQSTTTAVAAAVAAVVVVAATLAVRLRRAGRGPGDRTAPEPASAGQR